jgi:hypothetical protein
MDEELRKKLASWKVQPEIPPDFQRGVWTRIAARETRSSKRYFLPAWVTSIFGTPRLAVCAVALSALIGAGLGLVESTKANTRNWKTLEAKYVQSVDPYEHIRSY